MASYLFTQHDKSLPLVALFNRVALCSQEFLTNIFSFWSATQRDDGLVVCAIFQNRRGFLTGEVYSPISISNVGGSCGEIVLDYGRCEGGVPVFEISMATSENETLKFDVIYSETREGIDNEQGDGPFFLFSNAMNTYRRESYIFKASDAPTKLEARYTQQSQRYQKVILQTPNSSITFSVIGFRDLRQKTPAISSSFRCSDETLNNIYNNGSRTVEMCTMAAGETLPSWEVTESGTRVFGQHWAPCRQGTRWTDITVKFDVLIEQSGASWGIHMVANGLIFCLDLEKRLIVAFEGLSHIKSVFSSTPRGSWSLGDKNLGNWIAVKVSTIGATVVLEIDGNLVAALDDLDIRPILGGSPNNSGSIAFGGPSSYIAVYRNLVVAAKDDKILYENDFLPENKQRTMIDFAVGTNQVACTLDGAKRDRAVFGGDLYVMGRSLYYSTGRFEAIRGSIELLTSHQTSDGYLGNLSPAQAPLHDENAEPPTDKFYSLSYSLLLITAIKDYWLHTGDENIVHEVWHKLEKLLQFTETFLDHRGLVVAPPPLSMDWFPMGGPIFGASAKINLAYYEALTSMARMSGVFHMADCYTSRLEPLKLSIEEHLWSEKGQVMKMSCTSNPLGICQDVNAYAVSTGIAPPKSDRLITDYTANPTAYQDIEGWDRTKIISPYATGFAAEAHFIDNDPEAAVRLIKHAWGMMANPSNVNYSGAHWEAMKSDGTPFGHDTSLAHGWSSWPTFLLPQYLSGLMPLEPGWKRWCVKPLLVGLSEVDVTLKTVAGIIQMSLRIQDGQSKGQIRVTIPKGTHCEVTPPHGWRLDSTEKNTSKNGALVAEGNDIEIVIGIVKVTL
ncbi:hypothetical protein V496_10599 [Pseudogymnoascus sp. VKM F-4515 (FW-2607)]|nr:hypothetical protein V496_10599 [Pseudogymnoascus sp. VKM F-4515 (FW-2607)]